MSGVDADPARSSVPGLDVIAGTEQFARMREAFHRLMGVDLSQRERALQAEEEVDPANARELRALLEHLDETDLLAAPEPAPPTRLGPFRLLHGIGRGGMGEVWLAERVEGDFVQQVAIKRVRDTALTSDLARRFMRERQILARLSHPNIAHLVDGGVGPDGRPWLAMEYVPGDRITHWCDTHGLDSAARVRLFLPVCDAVQFAHRNLVVHSDLKPANIQVDADGRPKLLDFGVARLIDAQDTSQTRTVAAMTPAYAAPEQRNGGPITTATDIYQLGVVLRELIVASPDCIGVKGKKRPSWTSSGMMRGDLGRILSKATAPAPTERYASVVMMTDDLSDWLFRRPLRSGIGSRRERLRKTLWQWRWPLALSGTVTLALALGLFFVWREARIAQANALEARTNFDVLLTVIGSANPGYFSGSEPSVSDWLNGIAARLQRDHADDPRLLHETLSGIGHGLMNFGRFRDAEPVLLAAHSAMRQDSTVTPDHELALLKLLALAQDGPDQIAGLEATVRRIRQLAVSPQASHGIALDAVASAAGALSGVGKHGQAQELFGLAHSIDPQGKSMNPHQRENYWRQYGWAALRAHRIDEARRGFAQSRLAQDENPTEFLPMRRAELDLLLAEIALRDRDAERASRYLALARPVYEREFPPGHCERARFAEHEAQLAMLEFGSEEALTKAVVVVVKACDP